VRLAGRDNAGMRAPIDHRSIAADVHAVPPPFRAFAVRSDEARHALDARAPYGRVHLLRTTFLDAGALASLAAEGWARVARDAVPDTAAPDAAFTGAALSDLGFADIDYAATTLPDLAAAAPQVPDLVGQIAAALQLTGVLGDDPAAYRRSVATRIDYLSCVGAGFHNDVSRHWSRCLFWVLALAAADVEFVMPHAGVRLPLAPGDLVVFDQTMAHGLCRPADGGQAVAASFASGAQRHQMFLTGELRLSDERWAALGAPWLPVQHHERLGALDLMVAEFDERSATIKRLRALRDCMKPGTCHVDQGHTVLRA